LEVVEGSLEKELKEGGAVELAERLHATMKEVRLVWQTPQPERLVALESNIPEMISESAGLKAHDGGGLVSKEAIESLEAYRRAVEEASTATTTATRAAEHVRDSAWRHT